MMVTNAIEFVRCRGELMREMEENKGKRGYGEDATKNKIGALLGLSRETGNERWEVHTSHGCNVDRSYVRQCEIVVYICPAGLYTSHVDLHVGNIWSSGRQWIERASYFWPNAHPGSIFTNSIFGVKVYDTEVEAVMSAVVRGKGTAMNWRRLLDDIEAVVFDEDHECPLSTRQWEQTSLNVDSLSDWLDYVEAKTCEASEGLALITDLDEAMSIKDETAIAVPEPADVVPVEVIEAEFSTGQATLGGDDVFPRYKTGTEVSEIDAQLARLQEAIYTAQGEIKEIKDAALAGVEGELQAKKRSIAMMSFACTYYQVERALAEAKAKSKLEALTICAYVVAGAKSLMTKVGTRQDVHEDELEYGIECTHVFGEFRDGWDLSKPVPEETKEAV